MAKTIRLGAALLFAWLLSGAAAMAVKPDEMLKDPVLEARARALSEELRCVVCEGQSIDDSDAEIARDIRILVREQLQAGKDEGQIRTYLTDRYGSYILLRPPFGLVWFIGPLALVLGGAAIVYAVRRNARTRRPPPPLGEAETARLQALIGREE